MQPQKIQASVAQQAPIVMPDRSAEVDSAKHTAGTAPGRTVIPREARGGRWIAQAERKIEHLLLVIDGSPGSLEAVRYTADLLQRRRGFQVHLLRLLPPMPPAFLEFGGAENPYTEQVLDNELRRDQQQWIASARRAAEPSVNQAVRVLRKAGIPPGNILREFSYPEEPRDAARTVLEYAHAKNCHTVIVSHKAHSWFREILDADLTEHILRHANGISVWVVQ